MTLLWITSWWNLLFLVPFGLAVVYLGLYVLTGMDAGDADADADGDLDHDLDADHDVDADSDSEVDHDTDSDSDLEDDDVSFIVALVSWIGVGRVPMSIVLTVLLMSFGLIGFIANQIAATYMPRDWHVVLVALPIAIVGSSILTRTISRLILKYLPLDENFARRRHELLGAEAEAIFNIDKDFGTAVGRDEHGDQFQVPCRIEIGAAPIRKGSHVKLVAYNANEKLFTVIESNAAPFGRGNSYTQKGK